MSPPPIRTVTRLLADMQTNITAAALRIFDGDIDRFGIFTLILRDGFAAAGQAKPISMHSIAASLSRPFETVRRHVGALIAAGLCERVSGGVLPRQSAMIDPRLTELFVLAHDCFVRFVEDLAAHDLLPPMRAADPPLPAPNCTQYAIDIMLGTADANKALHTDWLGLVIFSTVLCGNARRQVQGGDDALDGRHAVRASVVARVLGVPETTIRRRVAAMTCDGQPLVRQRSGLIVSVDWLDRPDALEISATSGSNVRRVLARAAASGFPFHAIPSAYIAGRPPLPGFA